MEQKKIVAYFRVSTRQQGDSGLGLEGQDAAIRAFAQQNSGMILASYTEVESGKIAERRELGKALAHARRSKAILVVAKLDRLARNVAFLSALMDSSVEFVACDNPFANRLTIHILAAVAEDEARRISERTKAALAAYKARGGVLGAALSQCRKLTIAARKKGAERSGITNKRLAADAYRDIEPALYELWDSGFSLRFIAKQMNELGHTTRRGKKWNHIQIRRILKRNGYGKFTRESHSDTVA
jgi:DNA invertase Pin-like site-specific DNA recombinase